MHLDQHNCSNRLYEVNINPQSNESQLLYDLKCSGNFHPFHVPPYLYSGNFFAARQHASQTKTQSFPFFNWIRYITVKSFLQVWHLFVFIFPQYEVVRLMLNVTINYKFGVYI